MANYKYAFFLGSLIFGIVWLWIFLKRPDLRKEQIFMSFFICLFGFTEHIYYGNYWTPEFLIDLKVVNVGFESLLLSFFYGGIASSSYELIASKKLKKLRYTKRKQRLMEVIISILTGALTFAVFWQIIDINIIYASGIGFLVTGLLISYFRKDLFYPALLNALIFGFLSLGILILFGIIFNGIFDAWWRMDMLTGYRIMQVPIEELMWHLGLGFAAGPLYEIWKGYKD